MRVSPSKARVAARGLGVGCLGDKAEKSRKKLFSGLGAALWGYDARGRGANELESLPVHGLIIPRLLSLLALTPGPFRAGAKQRGAVGG